MLNVKFTFNQLMNFLQDEEEEEPDSLEGVEDYTFKHWCNATNPGPREAEEDINDSDLVGETVKNKNKKECQIM